LHLCDSDTSTLPHLDLSTHAASCSQAGFVPPEQALPDVFQCFLRQHCSLAKPILAVVLTMQYYDDRTHLPFCSCSVRIMTVSDKAKKDQPWHYVAKDQSVQIFALPSSVEV
jgi:hypothetical protein